MWCSVGERGDVDRCAHVLLASFHPPVPSVLLRIHSALATVIPHLDALGLRG